MTSQKRNEIIKLIGMIFMGSIISMIAIIFILFASLFVSTDIFNFYTHILWGYVLLPPIIIGISSTWLGPRLVLHSGKGISKSLRIVLAAVMVSIVWIIIFSGFARIAEQRVVNEIAARLQVAPSWVNIRVKFGDVVKPGMTREEVHQFFDIVGPWTISSADAPDEGLWDHETNQYYFRENMYFTETFTHLVFGYWGFYYDENNILIGGGIIDSTGL